MRIFAAMGAPRATPASSLIMFMVRSLEVVECQVEGVEIAPATLGQVGRLAIGDERHALLGDAAVRAQRRIEAGEVVAVAGSCRPR